MGRRKDERLPVFQASHTYKYEAFQTTTPSFIWNSHPSSHRHNVREVKFKGELQKTISPVLSATTDDSPRDRRIESQEFKEDQEHLGGKKSPVLSFLGTPPIAVFQKLMYSSNIN